MNAWGVVLIAIGIGTLVWAARNTGSLSELAGDLASGAAKTEGNAIGGGVENFTPVGIIYKWVAHGKDPLQLVPAD